MKRRPIIWILATGLSVLAPASIAASPVAAKGHQAAPTGFARAGHFAPDRGPVSLLVDGKVALKGLTYKHVSPYLPVPAGTHLFALRTPAGKTVLKVRAGVPANGAVTIGAVTTRTGLAGNVYDDHLQTPKAGNALVRFVHTAPASSKVDIVAVGGKTLARNVDYPSATPYLSVAAGTYTIEVRTAGTKKVVLRIKNWTATAGSQSSVVIVNTDAGKLDAVPFIDSAGTAAAPKGGAATGLGGTAPDPGRGIWSTTNMASVLASLVIAAAVATGLTRRRRRLG